jgi:hypothetical protein
VLGLVVDDAHVGNIMTLWTLGIMYIITLLLLSYILLRMRFTGLL